MSISTIVTAPCFEALRPSNENNRSAAGCSFVAFNRNGALNVDGATSLRIEHDPSYYNQYSSRHSWGREERNVEEPPSHCELTFGERGGYAQTGITLVMDCNITYIRSGPHGGGLLVIGRWSLSRALLDQFGLIDGNWHTYCIRLTDKTVSVLVDWQLEIENRSLDILGSEHFLNNFFCSDESLLALNDVQRYLHCGGVIPRTISFSAHYANNGQMGTNLLSTYSRVDCQLKNVLAWDMHLPSPRNAYYQYADVVDDIIGLAVLVKAGKKQAAQFYLPHELIAFIGEFMWEANKMVSHRYAIQRLDSLLQM